MKNVSKNARTTINLADRSSEKAHKVEVQSLQSQKNKIIDSLKRQNRKILESDKEREVRKNRILNNAQANKEHLLAQKSWVRMSELGKAETQSAGSQPSALKVTPSLQEELDKADEEKERRLEEEQKKFEDIYDHEKVFQMVCSNPARGPQPGAIETSKRSEKLLTPSYADMFSDRLVGGHYDVHGKDGV